MNHFIDERQLVLRLKDGDQASFHTLYSTYAPKLFAFSKRYLNSQEDAEEIVQDVYIKLWKKKSHFKGDMNIKAYLYKSVYNESINRYKRRQLERRFLNNTINENYLACREDNDTSNEHMHLLLHRKISTLPSKTARYLHLNKFRGLTYQEISEKCKISVKCVEYHISKALKILKTELKEAC